jgi:hypothetical protein
MLAVFRNPWHVGRVLRTGFRPRRFLEAALCALGLAACAKLTEQPTAGPAPTYPVVLLTRGDQRQALAGVKVYEGKNLVGTSDLNGRVHLTLKGKEGGTAELHVKCPATFASPERPLLIGLRQLAPGSPAPKFETECLPLLRTVVVGVRAENGPNLPVVRLNRVIAHTDEFGVAHVLVQGSPGEQVTLTLNTTLNAALRPANPALTFVIADRDEMVLLEHKFSVERPAARIKRQNIPQPL